MVVAQLRTNGKTRERPKFFASHHTPTKLLDSNIMLLHYLDFELSSGRPPKSCDMYNVDHVRLHLKFLECLNQGSAQGSATTPTRQTSSQ